MSRSNVFPYIYFLLERGWRHLFSLYEWVVFIKPVKTTELPDQHEVLRGSEAVWFRQADNSDYSALIDVYPDEFSGNWPDKVKEKKIRARASKDIPCFLIGKNRSDILGATWCIPVTRVPFGLPEQYKGAAFEMVNTFIVPEARKRGLGQALRSYAVARMVEKGYINAVSYVWYSRKDSLSMNLKTGSILVGEKKQLRVLGVQKRRFSPFCRLDRIPLVSSMPTVWVIGYDYDRLKQVANAFKRFGIPLELVTLQSSDSAFSRALVGLYNRPQRVLERLEKAGNQVDGMALVLYADALKPEHCPAFGTDLDGLTIQLNNTDASPDLATRVIEADIAERPIAGKLYLDAIGEGSKIINWDS